MLSIDTLYGRLVVQANTSGNQRALHLYDPSTGKPFAILSVNLPRPHHALGSDEVFVKTWGENSELVQPILQAGLLEDTGLRESTHQGEAQVWRFKGELLRQARTSQSRIFCALITLDIKPRQTLNSDTPASWFHKFAIADSCESAEAAIWRWCVRVGLLPVKLSVHCALEQDPSKYEAPEHFIRA